MKISLFSESFYKGKRGSFLHPFKKGQILAVSQKGGEVRASREKMSDRITPDSFFSDTHAFVAPQPVRFFFFSSPPSRLTLQNVLLHLFTHRSAQNNVRFRGNGPRVCASSGESFSTAPRDSAFSRKKKKKRGKIFTLFLFKHAKDAFLRIKIHQ